MNFIKNINGIYLFSKSCKFEFIKKGKIFFKKQLIKYNAIKQHNSHLDIKNFVIIKIKINNGNKKIGKKN